MSLTLEIASVQTSLVWEDPEANRKMLQQKIKEVQNTADVILLPEMFSSGFTMNAKAVAEPMDGETVRWMQQLSAEKNIAIAGSLAIVENDNFYNRFVFVTPDGTVQFYDKRHTFTLAGEDKVYTAGKEKLVFLYKGWRICPLVCYDLRFPVWARNVEDYDLLLFVANWPKKRIQAWDVLLQARAIENMSYCVGVNRVGLDGNGHEYVGHSAVYNPLGALLSFSEKEEIIYTRLLKNELDEARNKFKFLDDRDQFTVT
ncbi:amidohydrolase [Joostella sp. CR20]|uniref:amidohydrolase n=1 Tax=Joostella sp. CR20 TaxID=2804312 RepID=UPI00313B09EA